MAASLYWIAAFAAAFFYFISKMNFEMLQKRDPSSGLSTGAPCYKRQAFALLVATAAFVWVVYIKRFKFFDSRPASYENLFE